MIVASINLVPLATRRSLEIRRIAAGWGTFVFVALAACLTFSGVAKHRLWKQQLRVDMLTGKCQPVEQMMLKVADMTTKKKQLDEFEQILAQLVPSDDLLQTLGVLANAASDDRTTSVDDGSSPRIRRAHISLQDAEIPTEPLNGLPPTATAHVSLTIWGEDDGQIQSCLERMRQSPRFREVRIRTSGQDGSTAQRQVEIDAFVYVSKKVPK